MKVSKLLPCTVAVVLLLGCKSIGPKTIPRDRFDYSAALAESWKNQMLLNLVKTRYIDLPIFLDVGQIVSGYTFEVSASGGVSLEEVDAARNVGAVGGAARYTDRPTITYTPLTGDKFLESMLTPIDPAKVFSLMQAGYPADFILGLSLDSFNGLRNHPSTLGSRQTADPEFFRVLTLLREIQDAGAAGMRVDRPTNGLPATVFFFRSDRIEPAVAAQIAEVRELLGLAPGQHDFRIVQSPVRGATNELAVTTRSLSRLLSALSQGVDIPASHAELKLTPPLKVPITQENNLLRVHSGPRRPARAFATVSYEKEWFWVASDDWKSKRTFSSILFLFTLAGSGAAQNLPTLTIPAQ